MRPDTLPLGLDEPQCAARSVTLGRQSTLLTRFAENQAPALLTAIDVIRRVSPLRHMVTPGGWAMSVAMTNCGEVGWVSDRTGYRYDGIDPATGQPWPSMPAIFSTLAAEAAAVAGFAGFVPDVCLINRYRPGARLSLHQDRNERDFSTPIVSLSLGLPAIFLWGGQKRADRPVRILLTHGDVAVWGGIDRLNFHGVHPLAQGVHPMTGAARYNLTFRKAS